MNPEAAFLNPTLPFTFETYKAFVEHHDLLYFRRTRILTSWDGLPGQVGIAAFETLPRLYLQKLPTYLLARCPLCGGRVWEASDTFSLLGVGWWFNVPRGFGWYGRFPQAPDGFGRHTALQRLPTPSYQAECNHVQAVMYGVNLNGIQPTDINSWYTESGAERPGVLQPFVAQSGSYVVLHSLPVGRFDDAIWQPRYTVHFQTYFSADVTAYPRSLHPQDPNALTFCWPFDKLDYALAPWIAAGKVWWLDPKLENLPLRGRVAAACPYTQVPGLEGRWSIVRGGLERVPDERTVWDLLENHGPGLLREAQAAALTRRGLRPFERH